MRRQRTAYKHGAIAAAAVVITAVVFLLFTGVFRSPLLTPQAQELVLAQVEGRVEVLRFGAMTWDLAYVYQVLHAGDRLRTDRSSRVTLLLPDGTVAKVGESSDITISSQPAKSGVGVLRRALNFFQRKKTNTLDRPLLSPTNSVGIRG